MTGVGRVLFVVVAMTIVASSTPVVGTAAGSEGTAVGCTAGHERSLSLDVVPYDADASGSIEVAELGAAAADYTGGEIPITTLADVSSAYVGLGSRSPPDSDVRVTDVVDGDTLEIRRENGVTDTVRLVGVDAPEANAAPDPGKFEGIPDTADGRGWLAGWGRNASSYVERLVNGSSVGLCFDRDAGQRRMDGHLLAYVQVNQFYTLNTALVDGGYARVRTVRDFERRADYLAFEADAQTAGRALWEYPADHGTQVIARSTTITSTDPRYDDDPTVSLRFTRETDGTVFERRSHDVIVTREPRGWSNASRSTYYMLVHQAGPSLYSARTDAVPVTADRWDTVDGNYITEVSHTGIDTFARGADKYAALDNWRLFTTDRLTEPWTNRTGTPPNGSDARLKDPGLYYENGTYHVLYEAGDISDHSGGLIGYATNDGNITDYEDWVVHDPVYSAPEGYATGDYDVVKTGGLYFVFGDYTTDHPRYNVSVWVTDDLGENLTRLGNVASPIDANGEIGIQDADVVYDPHRDRYVLYAHTHGSHKWLVAATGTITVYD